MSLARRAETAAVRAGFGILRKLGPAMASDFGGGVTRAFGPLLAVSRVADANLRRAMPELDAAARRRIIRGVWENLGRVVGELPHLPVLNRTPCGPGWEIEGEHILHAQTVRGGPAIFFTGHLGNWEIAPAVAAALGVPVAPMYRPASNPAVDRIICDLRRKALGDSIPMFTKGAAGARSALAHLGRGGCLGLVVDQKQNDGIAVDFFGRKAMTAPALAALALRFRCPVIPFYAQRVGSARLRIVCEEPLTLPDSGDRHADIAALMRAVNAALERWIWANPESWLWLHRRWPKSG